MTGMRSTIDLAADTGRQQAVLIEITSLGFGFANDGAVLYRKAAGKEPVFAVNGQAKITPELHQRLLGASGDEAAYIQILVDEGVLKTLSSPSAGGSDPAGKG